MLCVRASSAPKPILKGAGRSPGIVCPCVHVRECACIYVNVLRVLLLAGCWAVFREWWAGLRIIIQLMRDGVLLPLQAPPEKNNRHEKPLAYVSPPWVSTPRVEVSCLCDISLAQQKHSLANVTPAQQCRLLTSPVRFSPFSGILPLSNNSLLEVVNGLVTSMSSWD